jgi:hypothetical protein
MEMTHDVRIARGASRSPAHLGSPETHSMHPMPGTLPLRNAHDL